MAETPKFGTTLTIDKNAAFSLWDEGFVSKTVSYAVKVAEKFDNEIIEAVCKIARQEGITCVTLLNKQDIVRALRFYEKASKHPDPSSVGGNIKYWRERAGLTQEGLAARIRVTKTTVSRYESGAREPALGTLAEIADACGVTFLDIVLRRE